MRVTLTGLDGTNPLGFLAALGTLARATRCWPERRVRVAWDRDTWNPVLHAQGDLSRLALVESLAASLRAVPSASADLTDGAKRALDRSKTSLKQAWESMRSRRLSRDERRAVVAAEIEPLRQRVAQLRSDYRVALGASAPDPVVALGANLTVSSGEFRDFCTDAASDSGPTGRRVVDFCAAYGTEARESGARIAATPLALLNGSGHQDFLGSAAELMAKCEARHIDEALFGPWRYADEKLSLRWDPVEDRRYALMATDPTASGQRPRTVWGANRLAFEAVQFFPIVPTVAGVRAAGFVGGGREAATFYWPLWEAPLTLWPVKSLLALGRLDSASQASVGAWRARGVASVWSSRRIAVGRGANVKYNFTPALSVWS